MNAPFDQPVILLGGGGHARVLLDCLSLLAIRVLGVTTAAGDDAPPLPGIKVLGNDDAIGQYAPSAVLLVNAVGITRASDHRKRLQEGFAARGYRFPTVIHPAATVSASATLAESCQIMAGAVIQTGARIGRGCLVNTLASVDHDCVVGDYTHIAPGAHLSGGVRIGECTLIGTGAAVIQDVRIGAMCTVGAGSAVIRNLPDGARAGGVPARALGQPT